MTSRAKVPFLSFEYEKTAAVSLKVSDYFSHHFSLKGAFKDSLYDKDAIASVKKLADQKRILKPKMVIVVGIGGSSLGACAVYEALRDALHEETPPLFFAETLDVFLLNDLLSQVDLLLRAGEKVVLTIVTKSGTTLETLVNAQLFLNVFVSFFPQTWMEYIVVITDPFSVLEQWAHAHGCSVLSIAQEVGGRYSIFTPAGLFPLAMAGIPIDDFIEGAHNVTVVCEEKTTRNGALISALLLFEQYKRGIHIHDTFLFSPCLENVGKWYRQLMGESIGKETASGVRIGITPTVSIGTSDLHSVAQLYLGGPFTTFTTFVTIASCDKDISLSSSCTAVNLIDGKVKGRFVHELMNMIAQGTMEAYLKEKRPFCTFTLPEKNAYYLGQFMYIKLCEIVYLAYLLGVNPFDQPHVELYKKEVQQLLSTFTHPKE